MTINAVRRLARWACLATLACPTLAVASDAATAAEIAIPYPETPFKGKIGPTRETSVTAWPEQPKAPAGAPNVMLIMLDDLGFGAAGTFGGPAASPEIDKLAAEGIRYNAINTDALCAPTRASLLSGRNHHQVGFGNQPELGAGLPAYNGIWHADTASIAEMLKDNGYSTAAFGKWHNSPDREQSPAGPFDHWPTGLGFEYFYGFMGGESSNWEPRLFRGTNPVENGATPAEGFHLTTALVDDAIHWVRQHEAVAPDKPFFVYFAPSATHTPHHVPKEWIDKYRGKFDAGWDRISDETFARQKKMGVIPATADKTARPEGLPAWDSLTADQKKLFARQMEVYAGYLSHTDHEVGRLIQELRDEAIDNNTLVIYMVGDNGGSAEAGIEGSDHELARYAAGTPPLATQLSHIDDLGGALYDNHYAAAWAWAMSTPFQWTKLIASHFGGTRNGLVVSWPGHTSRPDAVRGQFGHVNDIAPTILAAAKIPFPTLVKGVRQIPFEGVSLLPTFTDPRAPDRHRTQYFEVFGNRAIYKDGWVAAARRFTPWYGGDTAKKMFDGDFAHDKWELYDVAADYSEAHDLAAQNPAKLKELQAEFDKEAWRNGVYPMTPLPDGPKLVPAGKTHFVYYGGVDRLDQDAVPKLGGRSHKMTAELDVPAAGAAGVIVAEGGRYGGMSLYVKDGRVIYENNTRNMVHETLVSSVPLPAGKVEVQTIFTVDPTATGTGPMAASARAGTAEMFINGRKVGETKFSQFGDFRTSITETFDVGKDTGSPVSAAYAAPYPFTGKVDRLTIDLIK
jgi:arylsulfatase A-like enzyme